VPASQGLWLPPRQFSALRIGLIHLRSFPAARKRLPLTHWPAGSFIAAARPWCSSLTPNGAQFQRGDPRFGLTDQIEPPRTKVVSGAFSSAASHGLLRSVCGTGKLRGRAKGL